MVDLETVFASLFTCKINKKKRVYLHRLLYRRTTLSTKYHESTLKLLIMRKTPQKTFVINLSTMGKTKDGMIEAKEV